jgi:hypothetical protein
LASTPPASTSGQSIPGGWALHLILLEQQEPGVAVELLERLGPAVNRHRLEREHEARQAEIPPRTMLAKIAAAIAASPRAILIQSTMPAGPRQLERRAVQEATP